MAFVEETLAALDAAGRRRVPRVVDGRSGLHVELGGRRLLNVSSNDYLGLAGHAALAEAAVAAMAAAGVGAGASRLITGNLAEAAALEDELARFHGTPAARLFNTGYAANTGVIPVLVERGDVVFSDELNHASIIDGCRLSRAEVVVYPHNDAGRLGELLTRTRGRRRLIVTESLFSMDGDFAPLDEIRRLAAQHDAMLMVDDAHTVGAVGDGRGLGVAAGADVVVATLGKSFGASGAYALCSRPLADLLWNRARSLVFSTGLPVPVLAAARAALRIIAGGEGEMRRARLQSHVARVGSSSHIVPLVVGGDERAVEAMNAMSERGLLVQAIRPPTVPVGAARLRLSLSAGLSEDEMSTVRAAVDGMADWWRDVPRGTES